MADKFDIEGSDLVVIGGGIGNLVAAVSAANAGAHVSLVLPSGGMGAGFASLQHENYLLDIGCRRFDFTTDPKELPLEDYTPGVRTRPFADYVRSFVEDTLGLELIATPAPQMSYSGKLTTDFATSLDLTAIPDLFCEADLAATLSETSSILSSNTPSPFKLGGEKWPDLSHATLEEASLINHGATFHNQLIRPFATKLFPGGWQTMPADLAAKIWTPIFFPQTINQGCRREMARGRPPVTYFYPASGHFGALVDRLRDLVAEKANIQVITPFSVDQLSCENGVTTARQEDGRSLQWSCPYALSLPIKNYCQLAGLQRDIEEISLAITWIEVKESDLLADPSTVMVFDADTSIYRISFAGKGDTQGCRVIAVEMGGHSTEYNNEGAVAFLVKDGILKPDAAVRLLRQERDIKIVAPSSLNREAVRTARTSLEERGVSPTLIGTLNDLKADMLNDQTLQGLKLAQSL